MDNAQIKKYSILGVAALLVLVYIGNVFGYRSDCVRFEIGVPAQYDQNRNNYDNMWKRFREIAKVPGMYTDDLKKLYDSAMKARYGAEGSKAVFQFIQEHNPTLDASMYTRLQAAIESGRTSFAADQKELIDKKREYQMVLNGNRSLLVGFWFSFPHIDLAKYDIVTSDATEDAFRTKRSGEIELR